MNARQKAKHYKMLYEQTRHTYIEPKIVVQNFKPVHLRCKVSENMMITANTVDHELIPRDDIQQFLEAMVQSKLTNDARQYVKISDPVINERGNMIITGDLWICEIKEE